MCIRDSYYLHDKLDEDLVSDIYDFFRTQETDNLDPVLDEFSNDDVEIEDLQLVRLKFLSELAN